MKYNYHTHTIRCGHAVGKDEEYIKAAIKAGFNEIGFADHTPWHYESGYEARGMRMNEGELYDYINSIHHLQEKYKDKISIKIGLECEYFPEMMDWLKETLDSNDINYIIMGQHFHLSDEYGIYYGRPTDSVEVLNWYIDDVKKGLSTGLYSYLAHPDLIHFKDTKSKVYEDAMTDLCLFCKEHNIPLEFNMLGYREKRHYPNKDFWNIVSKVGNQVIIGFDAHEPKRLNDDKLYESAKAYLEGLNLEIVPGISFLK